MIVSYVTVDVFTDRQFGGNQLAVIPDARGLETAQMQAIAAEFGYAETTFVLPPRDQANTAHVRIFTPAQEMPFAGHPNVGTAFVLARAGEAFGKWIGGRVVFEEAAGLVPVDIVIEAGAPSGATLTAPEPLTILGEAPIAAIARCIGLEAGDVVTTHHPPLAATVGARFIFTEVRDVATVSRSRPDPAQFRAYFPIHDAVGVHVYARLDAQRIHCRMFAPLAGVTEDAATGSANVALAALLAHLEPAADAQIALEIRQGVEMGRPSLLLASAEKQSGKVVTARVGGGCVPVMEGRLTLK